MFVCTYEYIIHLDLIELHFRPRHLVLLFSHIFYNSFFFSIDILTKITIYSIFSIESFIIKDKKCLSKRLITKKMTV